MVFADLPGSGRLFVNDMWGLGMGYGSAFDAPFRFR